MLSEILYPTTFTLFQICWAVVWAARHVEVRRSRHYADNRTQADTNSRYRVVSYFLYVSQNALCVASFWSNSPLLLKIHDSNSLRILGLILIGCSTIMYFMSLKYLGRNYSPCFDSHVPVELISSGPYKLSRHPMYLGKLLVGIGNFIISGSLWFALMLIYLALETVRTIRNEEQYLTKALPEYAEYKKRTPMMIPFLL
ncbi:MAG TPA: isoprenylcysteine carboxylmethyltransferase family protein [Pyrinomonadaceae bacterium]|nr:isoprenylcysteine carboxylmethyltransferase family protein [Pyrinomonadaceae bacterium]